MIEMEQFKNVAVSGTVAEAKRPFLVMTTRYDYMMTHLPDYKAMPTLESLDDDAMEGIELRLAAAQVEHMSYQARLSELQCSFTLRQTC